MDRLYPIYTESTDCRDCYKCVRQCPVKAIKIENGRATVIADRCIACGICVHTCPTGAKKVRDDLGRAKHLLKRTDRVIATLAPSYASEWSGIDPQKLAGALKELGFYCVSETALGAEAVTATIAARLDKPGLQISTACPVVVDYIRKYLPQFTANLTPILSPMQTHAKMLKEHFGADCAVIFFGPCIAKKCECEETPGLTDLALSFRDLKRWIEEEKIDLNKATAASFEPTAAAHGALYPIVGGMNKTLEDYELGDAQLLSVSGMDALGKTLENLDPSKLQEPVFLEALACPGGCIGGPQVTCERPILSGELAILKQNCGGLPLDEPSPAVSFEFQPWSTKAKVYSEEQIKEALKRVGKHKAEDELNCGGCGYETCRNFAQALLNHKAEPDMCLSYLRNLAQKKANALLRCMPSGVVIVDASLHIIECNENFAITAGSEALLAYTAKPGLEGADLRKILPFAELFQTVNQNGEKFHSDSLRNNEQLLNVTIFPIETGSTVGGIILDVTQTEIRRELIAQKAREVIEKNMTTVQDIACKLGEHMADTEILLRSIADDYSMTEKDIP